MGLVLNRKSIFVATLLATLSCLFLFSNNVAEAAYTDLPRKLPENTHQYINLTNTNKGNASVEGDPGEGAGLRASYIKVYSPTQRDVRVGIHLSDRGVPFEFACEGYTIRIRATPYNNIGGEPIDPKPSDNDSSTAPGLQPDGCSQNDGDGDSGSSGFYYFTIPQRLLSVNTSEGHIYNGAPLWEATVQFLMTPITGGHTAAFRVFPVGGGRLGFPADPYYTNFGNPVGGDKTRGVTIYPSALASDNSPSSCSGGTCVTPKDHIIKSKVCNSRNTTVRATIQWQDDDRGTRRQSGGFSASIREYASNGAFVGNVPTLAGTPVYGNGPGYGTIEVNLKPKTKYQMWFANVWGGNGVKIFYPSESGDYDLACDVAPPPPPTPPDISCKNYNHNLAPSRLAGNGNAVYRFTVFSKAQNYVASSPPTYNPATKSPTRSTAQGRGPWKTFSQAPIYQSGDIKTNEAYSDGLGSYTPNSQDMGTFKLNFPEPSGPDRFVYIEKWDHSDNWNGNSNPPPTNDWAYLTPGTYSKTNCYSASCDITVYSNVFGRDGTSNGGVADVEGGQRFFVSATITNTGLDTLPSYLRPNYPLSISTLGDAYAIPFDSNPMGVSIAPGASSTRGFFAPAPNDAVDRGFYGYPDFYGKPWTNPPSNVLGGVCSVRVHTHQRFDINPYAKIDNSMDKEDPREVIYTVGGTNSYGQPARISWDSKLYRKRAATPDDLLQGVFTADDRFGTIRQQKIFGDNSSPLVPSRVIAGDQVCAWSKVSVGAGYVGPYDHIIALEGPREIEDCPTISDKPYLRTYGADVLAGSGFGGGCNPTGSGIKAFRSTYAGLDRSGSGSQFAAIAMGAIEGFDTASLRTSTPRAPVGLSFGNDPLPAGGYGGFPICASDYYKNNKYPITNTDLRKDESSVPGGINLTPSFKDGKQTIYNDPEKFPANDPNFQLTINGTPPGNPFRQKHTIFVEGDVIITKDIVLKDLTDPQAAPALAVIVRGNIYIDKAVTRLDGMYVAQPKDDGSKGKIFTCTNDGTPYTKNDGQNLINNCSSQLKINGLFLAKNVAFLRTFKSLRDSARRELAGSSGVCVPNDSNNSCAAELFQFTPEIYLSPPPLYIPPPEIEYQSYQILPPIL